MTEKVQAVRPKISHALVDKLIGKEDIRIYHCGVCGASLSVSEGSCKVCGTSVDWNGVKQGQKGRKRKSSF